jgi:FkbM family methyltransferase
MRYPAWLPVTNEASHTFVPSVMAKRPIVLDLGANLGDFHDALLLRFSPERYIAVEPTASLAAALSKRGLCVVELAVAPESGPVSFSVKANREASSIFDTADSETVRGISYSDLLIRERLDRIDLVKMDIEGAEIFALGNTEREVLRVAKQVTVEFHDFCGILSTDLVDGVIARMKRFGFYGTRFSVNNTDWLFVRHDEISRIRWASVLGMALLRRSVHRLRMLRDSGWPKTSRGSGIQTS